MSYNVPAVAELAPITPAEILLFSQPGYSVLFLTLFRASWDGGRRQAAGAGNPACYRMPRQERGPAPTQPPLHRTV
jgi:hypothetical protein